MYRMQKTNFNKYTNAIVRESNNGKNNLIYHVDSQTALKHPQIPDSDYTNTVEHFVAKKKKNKPIISRFNDSTVSNEIFKSENPEIYQGFQRGGGDEPTPSVVAQWRHQAVQPQYRWCVVHRRFGQDADPR
jgi:hypothetical protein